MGHSDLGSSCRVRNFARPATRNLRFAATFWSFPNAVGCIRFESSTFKRNFRPFQKSDNRSRTGVKCDLKSHNWHKINLNQRINVFHRVQNMRRSIGKLDSSKHLLDEVGASDASNRGKSVSWVPSSACERRIGNACVQKKKYLLLRLWIRQVSTSSLKSLRTEENGRENICEDHV